HTIFHHSREKICCYVYGCDDNKNMDLLPVNFYVLRFCGVWKEHKNSNLVIRFISFCYRYTIAAIIYHFTIFEMAELIRIRNDVEDLTESLFLVLTFMCLCLKYLNVLMRQCELRALLDCFRANLCQPRNSMEESILKQYDLKAKRIACAFMFISQISGFLVLIEPLMTQNERQLPMKMYVPYSMVELLPYLLTYLEQVAVVFYGVSLNVAFDSLVYGFIIHTCGQIELLCYRLSETFRFLQENNKEKEHDIIEKFAIAECVRHHVSVCNIMHRIQSLFMWIITILFFFSLITLCSSIYQMSNKNFFSVEFFVFLVYLGAMLFQVFSYCWYGNELDLKNKSIAHAIYASNWTVISAKQRKSLSFMMMMSQGGRMLSFYGICSLVLSTFTWILKTSYSSFNLLQQTTI
ncbi:OR46A protein, partial [Acromyrmex charruanus]